MAGPRSCGLGVVKEGEKHSTVHKPTGGGEESLCCRRAGRDFVRASGDVSCVSGATSPECDTWRDGGGGSVPMSKDHLS